MAVHKKCAEKVKADCIKSSADEIEPEDAPATVAWMDIAKENIQTYYKKGSPYDFYEKKEKLGEGGGGAVYKVVCKADGAIWALKEIRKDSYDLPLLEREILVMKDLNHSGLVTMKEAFQDAVNIYLVLDLVKGGELFDRIIEQESFSEEDAAKITAQLLGALDYMHSKGCAHRDIKAENVLCVDKTGTEVKLADFGLANALGEATKFQSCVGTTDYMAPEMLESLKYSFGVDVWSLGVLTYIMLSGYPPFYGKTENDKVEKILTAKFDFNHAVWDDVSDSAKNFICRCLALQPKQRWSVKELLKHPWITGVAREGDARAEGKVLAPLQSRRRLNEFAQEVKNSKRAGGTPQGAATVNVAVEETKKKKKDHK
jgi:serine/threonine protein kinase